MKQSFPQFFFLIAFFLGQPNYSNAQGYPKITGWADDTHYILNKENAAGEIEKYSVEVKSGKEKKQELNVPNIREHLPEGIRATRRNSVVSEDGNHLILNQQNDLFYFKRGGSELQQLTANHAKENNPTFSPDGKHIAFTRNKNLYTLNLRTGLEKQLTTDGSDIIYNGWASWVYYEEILGRGSRYRAFYWSPDSKKIAFLRFDDSPVPTFPIFHHIGGDEVHGEWEMTHYPKSGDPNPLVNLGVADIASGDINWMKTDPDLEYTAWIFWTPDASKLFFQQMNRDQNLLHILSADPVTGERALVYSESQPTWVEFFEKIHFLKKSDGFILRSNKDGWYNLYHYDLSGNLVKKITDNDWRVTSIVKIDEEQARIFFKGTGEHKTESHFYTVKMNGKGLRQLTKDAGNHKVHLSPAGSYFIDDFSHINHPGTMTLYDSEGKLIRKLGEKTTNPNAEKGMKVELFTIKTSDGYDLPAMWVLPPGFDPTKKYPVIFSIYGGPDAGTVSNQFRNYTWNPLYEQGVIRFVVDHRGSGKFGKKGLDFMHRSLGKWEIHDYIESVKWLREQPFIDADRMGIQGSSYGGYMAAMALTQASEYFTHGVASASVTDWKLYDNIYTERYMDTPNDNSEGYEFGSVMTHAKNLKGELLIVHGTIDDNVHLQNSIQLISELQDLGKEFEMMVYPGGRHGWGGAKGRHSFNLSQKFWEKHFFNKEEKVAKP